jgi:hypothetical protein
VSIGTQRVQLQQFLQMIADNPEASFGFSGHGGVTSTERVFV